MEARISLFVLLVVSFTVVSSYKAAKSKFFDVRNKEEECCRLGRLAGEKGFYCVPRFYEPRVLHRNYNRPHVKDIPGLLRGKQDPVLNKLMRSFSQCVTTGGYVFKKCCRYATLYGS